jgi:hypothetical protein
MNELSSAEKIQLIGLLTKVRASIKENAVVCERQAEAKL